MKKWLILRGTELLECIKAETQPSPETGYDVTGLTVTEVTDFKPTDTYEFVDGTWQPKLDIMKERAVACVNKIREKKQMQYLTQGEAKMYIYTQKSTEVDAAGNNASPDPLLFPFAAAEATATGLSVREVLDKFKAARDTTVTACALIEATAQKVLADISQATTEQEIDTALNLIMQS